MCGTQINTQHIHMRTHYSRCVCVCVCVCMCVCGSNVKKSLTAHKSPTAHNGLSDSGGDLEELLEPIT